MLEPWTGEVTVGEPKFRAPEVMGVPPRLLVETDPLPFRQLREMKRGLRVELRATILEFDPQDRLANDLDTREVKGKVLKGYFTVPKDKPMSEGHKLYDLLWSIAGRQPTQGEVVNPSAIVGGRQMVVTLRRSEPKAHPDRWYHVLAGVHRVVR